MDHATKELKQDLQQGLDHLRELRDEIRVKLHLAGMDAKDEWKKLEPRLSEIERLAEQATEASRTALADAVGRLKKLRDAMS